MPIFYKINIYRPSTIPEISKKVAITTQNVTVEDVKKDFNITNTLVDNSNPNSVTVKHEDLIKETKPIKKRSLFDQESDDDDLFTNKTVFPAIKPDILESKKSLSKDKKSSRNIFSESDSDEEFMDSKLKTKELHSHSIIDNNSTKPLDSSSDDDLFSIKSINKTLPIEKSVISSSPVLVEVLNKSNEIKHVPKPSPLQENKVTGILNKVVIDELKKYSVNSSVADNKVTENESLPNKNTLNSNVMEFPNNDNIMVQSNQKSSISKPTKKLSNFFSSDEDDFDDDTFFNVNVPNKNSIYKDQPISNAKELGQNIKNELSGSKVNLFDSSSDDDIFITNKPNNNLASSISKKQSSFNEIKDMNISKEIDDCAIINKIPNIDNINQTGNYIIDKNSTNTFSLLSDDDEDENYLSFDKNISDASINVSNNQNIREKILTVSLSSEELSPQMDQKNQDTFHNTLDSLQNSKNHESFSKKEILIPSQPKNEIISNENTIQSNKSSILSSSDDEQQLIFSPKIENENSNKETKMISPTSNLLPENVLNNRNQESSNEKDIKITKLPISSENTNQGIKNSTVSSSDDVKPISFNSNIQNVNTIKEIKMICPTSDLSLKDSIDGPYFSSQNSKNETSKKVPGIANLN